MCSSLRLFKGFYRWFLCVFYVLACKGWISCSFRGGGFWSEGIDGCLLVCGTYLWWFGHLRFLEGFLKILILLSCVCCILICRCMQNHSDTIINTSDTVLRKMYLSFYWKGCVWEGVGDRTELQHIDPHSIGHNRVSFPFSWAAQPGAHSAICWLSLPQLVTNVSGLQTNWLPVFTELYNSSTPTSSCGRHNCTHSTHPRSRL